MRILSITLFFALFVKGLSLAQHRQMIDSLRHQLSISAQDTNRVILMVKLGNETRWSTPNKAMRYCQQALQLARQYHFLRGECVALSELGNVYRELGNLPKSLEVVLQALNIAESNQYRVEASGCYSRMGNIYYDLKDHKKGLFYGKKSLEIAEQIRNRQQIAIQYLNIGALYTNTNQLDSAVRHVELAYRYSRQNKQVQLYSSIIRNLALIQDKLKNYPIALTYYRQSIQTALENEDHRNAAFSYTALGAYFQRSHQLDSCIFYAQKALAQAKAGPFNRRILEAAELLVKAYREKKEFQQAFFYQELAIKTRESLFGAGNIQAMQTIITNDEKRKQEVKQAQVAYQVQLKQYAFLVGLGIFLLIIFFLYRNNRQKQKANTVLEKALTELKSTQAQLIQKEKLASLGELTAGIAHEIQNPLNFVNNFSELSVDLAQELKEEVEKPDIDKELVSDLVGDLVQNQEKINHHGKRASSIVKGMLEHSKASTGERELTDINQLADEYLRLAYHGIRAKNQDFNCELVADFAPGLPKIEVIPQDMGRVLLNLINNAFYAVNERKKQGDPNYQPKVTVSTKAKDNHLEIRVKDNGTGMTEATKAKIFQPFFTTKSTGEGTGLGLSLAYDIVTKGHGGTIEVESVESEGTTFIVKLPIQNS
jgi:two-component system NtrC family sensor kinase